MPAATSEFDLLQQATFRLIRTVDGFSDEEWRAPSMLPGWSRAHVVAHLVLGSEGFAGALDGLSRGEQVPVYASVEERTRGIEELASARPSSLRDRLLGATTEFGYAVGGVPDDRWSDQLERHPDGPTVTASDVPHLRLREMEIHHADLDAGYTSSDWSLDFAEVLVTAMMGRRPASGPFSVRASDTGREWTSGDGGPTVSGSTTDLAWWLAGRGAGERLTTDGGGTLPGIEAW